MRPEYTQNKRITGTGIVGNWRHHKYLLYPAGTFITSQMAKLGGMEGRMHFNAFHHQYFYSWINMKLSPWVNYKYYCNLIKSLFRNWNLVPCKTTQFNKSGMDFCGTAGIINYHTRYIPKHIMRKRSHYVPEISCKVMQVVSRFQLEDKY